MKRWYMWVGLAAGAAAIARLAAIWMPYTKGASNATGPYVSAGTQTYQQANNAEYQYDEATGSFEQHFLSPVVLGGGVATKDGVTASQLDVTTCSYYAKQTDGTLRWRQVLATNFSTLTHPSTTLFLDFNPDGTTSFATTHSGVTNYVPICSVTTDASSNISVVTDARPVAINLFPGALAPDVLQFAGITLPYAVSPAATGLPTGNSPTLYIQQAQPSAPKKYDLWVKLPFS